MTLFVVNALHVKMYNNGEKKQANTPGQLNFEHTRQLGN